MAFHLLGTRFNLRHLARFFSVLCLTSELLQSCLLLHS